MFAITAINSSKTCNREEIEAIQYYGYSDHEQGIGYYKGRLVMFEGRPLDGLPAGVVHIKPVTVKEALLFQAQMHNEMSQLLDDGGWDDEACVKWYKTLAAAVR